MRPHSFVLCTKVQIFAPLQGSKITKEACFSPIFTPSQKVCTVCTFCAPQFFQKMKKVTPPPLRTFRPVGRPPPGPIRTPPRFRGVQMADHAVTPQVLGPRRGGPLPNAAGLVSPLESDVQFLKEVRHDLSSCKDFVKALSML